MTRPWRPGDYPNPGDGNLGPAPYDPDEELEQTQEALGTCRKALERVRHYCNSPNPSVVTIAQIVTSALTETDDHA